MISRLAASVAAIVSGLLFSQIPEYSAQYQQRLGGAVSELAVIVKDFDAAAKAFGMRREEALSTYRNAEGGFLPERGNQMRKTIDRYETLHRHDRAFRQAGAVERYFTLLNGRDDAIARATMDDYKPALPFTFTGLVFASIGLVIGFGIMLLVLRCARACTRLVRRQPQEEVSI